MTENDGDHVCSSSPVRLPDPTDAFCWSSISSSAPNPAAAPSASTRVAKALSRRACSSAGRPVSLAATNDLPPRRVSKIPALELGVTRATVLALTRSPPPGLTVGSWSPTRSRVAIAARNPRSSCA
jgi:hypothetical protein